MRRTLGLLAAATAAAGAIVLLRRRNSTTAARADLYFADGSMLSLDDEAPEIDGLMRAARAAMGAH
ncbi:MAG: hypothetical protein NTX95_03710 [Actinobacteria bacterium]|nr:hypothetical protein [Actinomycetota bacterium]